MVLVGIACTVWPTRVWKLWQRVNTFVRFPSHPRDRLWLAHFGRWMLWTGLVGSLITWGFFLTDDPFKPLYDEGPNLTETEKRVKEGFLP